MRRILCLLASIVPTLVFVAPGPAGAAPALGCAVSPGASGYTTTCRNNPKFRGPYHVGFLYSAPAAGDVYSWTLPAGYTPTSGCTSTDYGCGVDPRGGGDDERIPATLTVTRAGQSASYRAVATLLPVCGQVYC